MMRLPSLLLFLALLATSCSTPQHASRGRFHEQERANLIVRYYTDDTSYVLKPEAKEGPFLAVLNRDAVVDLAKHQAERELAVVVLVHYSAESQSQAVKEKWRRLLGEAGYQRVVFLRGQRSMRVNGLAVLASGG
jgi:hypothetical protein